MKTTRVALIISSLQCGGAERVVAMMANFWASHGREIVVISFDTGDNQPFYELNGTVSHVRLPDPPARSVLGKCGRLFHRISTLKEAIKAAKVDVVISHGEFINILCSAALIGKSQPHIMAEHSVRQNMMISRAMRWARDFVYARAQQLVVLNSENVREFKAIGENKIAAIPNALTPLPPQFMLPPILERENLIIGIGRLSREKGFDLLIQAFARAKLPGWKLVIWGEGPEREKLTGLIQTLNLTSQVTLPGRTLEVYQELTKAKIFVMPSRIEGFGNALCEAMAAGCAVVSFDCPTGPRSIVTDGVDGILVKAEDIDAMAETINKLAQSEERQALLAEKGVLKAKEFSQAAVMASWDEVITKVTSSL